MGKRKLNTSVKYIQANFTECDGIDMLSVFLRQGQKLFPNFSSNEKRTIYDGDLDYLNKNKEIIKVFRCQIKSLKSTRRTFKIEYKYLSACSNKVSFDPLFFFLVDVGNPKKPRFYYLNLTIFKPNMVLDCVKNKKSLNVKIRDFTELLTPDDLINDIENNYLYTLSLSELSLEELRILMSGITYLNSCINKIPHLRNFLFPNFYSFVVEYDKNTNEGFKDGFYSIKHDVISITPTVIDSKSDLIMKFNPSITRGKFISRSFNKEAINENVFKDYLSYALKEGFHYSEYLLALMPDVVLCEIIYAALNYETIKLGNKELKIYCESELISLDNISQIKLSDHNPFKRHFDFAVRTCHDREITVVKKVWRYWKNNGLVDDAIFNEDIIKFFDLYSHLSNMLIGKLFGENDKEYAFYYGFERMPSTKILYLKMASKNILEYLNVEELKDVQSMGVSKSICFENLNSFAPLFNTLVNKCYQVACAKFDCKYEWTSVDGIKIYVP